MSEIPRFDPFLLGDSKLIEESANGEYVLYADHLKELEGLRADVKSLEESLDAQFAKFEGCPHKPIEEGLCGCSFDRIGDVCAHHAPALAELRAQLRSKDEQLAGMREALEFIESETGWPLVPEDARRMARRALSGPSPAQEGTE